MEKYKVALLQMDSGRDLKKNKEQAQRLLEEAKEKGAILAALPETWNYIGEDMAGNGEPIPGSSSEFLREQAKKKGIYLLGGSLGETAYAGKMYNTSLFYSPRGELLGKYRKTHLFDVDIAEMGQEGCGKKGQEETERKIAYRESDQVLPGEMLVTADTELGTIGMSICYDLRFPELYRIQALEGAKILAVAANFTYATGKAHWEVLLRARAVENFCYVLACNQCGEKEAFKSYGNSMVISPWGEILARAGEEPCCLMAEIDLGQVERVRGQLPALKNRREDLYQITRKNF